jgi:cytoskeletal protein RodZ
MDLREISETLKIKYSYLKALEDDDLKDLPAEVYVKAYLNSYARSLDLNPEEILNTYNLQVSPPQPEKKTILYTEPSPQKKTRLKYFLIPSLILCLAIALASMQFKRPPEPQPPAPQPPATIPVEPAPKNLPDQVSTQQVLEIKAHDPTWLQVISDKTQSQELMMRPGESVTWRAKNCFSLKIGNAGGIKVFFNGKDIGKLGEKGQVIKLSLPENGA